MKTSSKCLAFTALIPLEIGLFNIIDILSQEDLGLQHSNSVAILFGCVILMILGITQNYAGYQRYER